MALVDGANNFVGMFGFTHRGNWSSLVTNYVRNNSVTHNNATWIYESDTPNSQQEPSDTSTIWDKTRQDTVDLSLIDGVSRLLEIQNNSSVAISTNTLVTHSDDNNAGVTPVALNASTFFIPQVITTETLTGNSDASTGLYWGFRAINFASASQWDGLYINSAGNVIVSSTTVAGNRLVGQVMSVTNNSDGTVDANCFVNLHCYDVIQNSLSSFPSAGGDVVFGNGATWGESRSTKRLKSNLNDYTNGNDTGNDFTLSSLSRENAPNITLSSDDCMLMCTGYMAFPNTFGGFRVITANSNYDERGASAYFITLTLYYNYIDEDNVGESEVVMDGEMHYNGQARVDQGQNYNQQDVAPFIFGFMHRIKNRSNDNVKAVLTFRRPGGNQTAFGIYNHFNTFYEDEAYERDPNQGPVGRFSMVELPINSEDVERPAFFLSGAYDVEPLQAAAEDGNV